MGNLKWHFAKTGGSDEEGLEDAGLSYFKSDPHHYIARETIQNVLDAKDGTVLQSIKLGPKFSSQPSGVAYYSN